jgi:two-component system OmpR family response regulator
MRILLTEDEATLGSLIRDNLARLGFAVDLVGSMNEARAAISTTNYYVILVDRRLPDGDGIELVRELRQRGNRTPVILATARGTISDRVDGLDRGADDYIVKPFAIEELAARIRALLRRPSSLAGLRLVVANLAVDVASGTVAVDDRPIVLPRREVSILTLLMRRVGRVVAKESLDEALYAFGEEVASNSIEVFVYRLRRRLEREGARVAIRTARGIGYLISAT